MAYLGAARSLAHNGTLRVPTAEWYARDSTSSLSLWPPGYPAALAAPIAFGSAPAQAARWINIVAAAITVGTIVLLVATPLGAVVGAATAIVVIVSQPFVDAHLSVLSEPLFLAVLVLLLTTLVYARDRLLLVGMLAMLLVMIRYAGGAGAAAAVTHTLFDTRFGFARRVKRAIVVALPSFVALLAWFGRTAAAHDRHATPEVALYGDWGATLATARDTLASWLVPLMPSGASQHWIAVAIAIMLAIFVAATMHDTSQNRTRERSIGQVSAIVVACSMLGAWYLIVVLASRALVGGGIPLDWRILLPAIVLAEIAVVTSVAYWWRAYHRPIHVVIAVAGLAWIAASASAAYDDGEYAATEGSDFAGTEWRNSPLIRYVREHGAGHELFSNWTPALYFHAARSARLLPDSTETGRLEELGGYMRRGHGWLVAFNEPTTDCIAPNAIATRLGMRQVVRTADGVVWEMP